MPISNEYEKKYNFSAIGIDEAGRGPLAGPVVAGAVLYSDNIPKEVNDSKKLTESKREKLYLEIIKNCKFGIGIATAEEIDQINIFQATGLAMQRAYMDLGAKGNIVLIDGNIKFYMAEDQEVEAIVGGDKKSISIAAASIIAKVTRDRIMMEMHKEYPQYGFDKHKGYPTKFHRDAIKQFGYIIGLHRRSFTLIQT